LAVDALKMLLRSFFSLAKVLAYFFSYTKLFFIAFQQYIQVLSSILSLTYIKNIINKQSAFAITKFRRKQMSSRRQKLLLTIYIIKKEASIVKQRQ
jgi:hypothetical protein